MLGGAKKKKGGRGAGSSTGRPARGLQATLNARLITLRDEDRAELAAAVPVPAHGEALYANDNAAWAGDQRLDGARERLSSAVEELLAPAARWVRPARRPPTDGLRPR